VAIEAEVNVKSVFLIIQYSRGIAKRPLVISVYISRDSSLYANTKIKTNPFAKALVKEEKR
jgi:hypothetical protein